MLRFVLLLLYFAAKIGGGWDPNGLAAQAPPTPDGGGGLDPNG